MSDYICYFAQSIPENTVEMVQNQDNFGKFENFESKLANKNDYKSQQKNGKLDESLEQNEQFEKNEQFDNISNNNSIGKYKSKIKNKQNLQVFGLNKEDRRCHIYAVGKTGMGKSTMLQNIVLQDIFAGLGVCLIDPHGDSVDYILDRIPKHRHKDVIYLNPADTNFPIGLNVLENENNEPDFLIAAGLMSVFKRIWVGSWSSRMEYILNNTLLALLEVNSQIKEMENETETLDKEKTGKKIVENKIIKQNLQNKNESESQSLNNSGDLTNSNQNSKIKILDQNIHKIKQNFDKINSSQTLISKNIVHQQNLNSNQKLSQELIQKDRKMEILKILGTQTLLGVVKMLSDSDFCNLVVECLQNPLVRNFWTQEFASFNDKYRQEAVAPILNKIGQFFSTPLTLNILGQTKSSLNFRRIMDNSQILLVNLSKGRLGDDNSNLLGSLIVNKIQLAAMTRVDLPEEKRKDWSLVVDEFQNFTTESFVTILSEARKYRLNLVLAHQYISQLEESGNAKTKNAIFGNVGSIISFQVGSLDARELTMEFGEPFGTSDLVNLEQNQIIVKMPKPKKNLHSNNLILSSTSNLDSNLSLNSNFTENYNYGKKNIENNNYQITNQNLHQNTQTLPNNCFKAVTLPSIFDKFGGQKDELIQFSRSKYASERQKIQLQINQFLSTNFQNSPKNIFKSPKSGKNNSNFNNSAHNSNSNSNKKTSKKS